MLCLSPNLRYLHSILNCLKKRIRVIRIIYLIDPEDGV